MSEDPANDDQPAHENNSEPGPGSREREEDQRRGTSEEKIKQTRRDSRPTLSRPVQREEEEDAENQASYFGLYAKGGESCISLELW